MKLTYFVGPYDLLNHKTLRPTPMTIEGIHAYYLLICIYCASVCSILAVFLSCN